MNIVVQFDRNYLPYTCVMLTSLCLNNPVHVDVYVLNSDLDDGDFEDIRNCLKQFDADVYDIKVDRSSFDKRLPVSEFWTLETYFVLKIPELISQDIDRVLFLDDDLIINGPIADLYETDFDGYEIIAARDSNGEVTEESLSKKQREMFKDHLPAQDYFNTGVMLLNLKQIRSRCNFDSYVEAMEKWNYEMSAPDQDILNYVHAGKVKFIDWKTYDLFARGAYNKGIEYDFVKNNVNIVHFAGQKPWSASSAFHFDTEMLWWEYASKSPLYEKLMEEYVFASMQNKVIEKSIKSLSEDNQRLVEINNKLINMIEQNEEKAGKKDYDSIPCEKIKLIIWDLDETLWKGTLSEGDVELPEENKKLLRCLTDHGIVNSISSKNDEEPALAELDKNGIRDLFVFNNINWEDKGPQIKDKLSAMGMRAENTLFIDDNPRNLEEAKHYSPVLMTALPDIIPYIAEHFESLPESDKAHKRLDQYKLLEKKTSAEKVSTSKEDFLFESDIRVTVNKNCLDELDRIHDMVQRTNQLNYTKHRDDKKLLEKLLTNDWNESGYVSVRDRFGDYGIVGFYCYNKREKNMEHFLFSCRVLGMGLEQYIYNMLGCPDFDVAEPVASKLEKDKDIPWITEDTGSEIKQDKTAGNRVRVLLKGPCDMSAIEPYLAGGSITTEFNYINSDGFVTTGQNHSMHIYQKATLPTDEIEQIVKDVPFIIDGDFETKLFENEYHVICFSLLQDLAAGLYRNKKTGRYISFSSRNYDLTDTAFAQRFIDKEIQGHNFDFTPEIINKFSEDWEFVGNTPLELLLRNLDYIYDHVPGKPIFILLLGSETDCDKNSEEFAGMADIYREINPIMEEFALDHDRMRIINPTEFIHSQDDFEDCINHFSRNVYYEIAGRVCDYINEAVEIIKKERNTKNENNVKMAEKSKGRRGLLFRTSEICNNTLNIFSDIIASKLKNNGIECGFVDLNKTGEELAEEYIREMNAGFDFALTFNSVGQHETTMSGQNVFEYMNVPFYNWIVDHPCEHTEDIESELRNYHIICLDRDHKKYLDNYFPKLSGGHFIPLGGTKWLGGGANDLESFKNREFDIVFTGGLFSLEDLENLMMEYPTDIRNLAFCMIEYMIDNRSVTNEEALKYALGVSGIEADADAFRRYGFLTAKTNPFIRSYVREEQIRYLMAQGVKLDIFGDGWERVDDRGNAVIHSGVSYAESVELTAKSKISLNIMPWFKDGLHDRIPTSMLNGSAVVTDTSRYINENFVTNGLGSELITFDISHPERTAEVLNAALSEPERLFEIAQRGRRKAEIFHTWEKRAEEFIKIVYG